MTVSIGIQQIRMQARFLDRRIADALNPKMRRFFMRAGGAIRTTARRLLRRARRKRAEELTPGESAAFAFLMQLFRRGQIPNRPKMPEANAAPGEPPRLHQKPTSLLKSRLFFALTPQKDAVVVGPEKTAKSRNLEPLERKFPFMSRAFATIQPRLSDYLKSAAG